MPSFDYYGKTTRKVYSFMPATLPAALQDSSGNPLSHGTFNGETLVYSQGIRDAAFWIRGFRGGNDPTNPYAPTWAASDVESDL